MKQRLISIVIPTYNEERDISKCLSSLLAQKYLDFEIIVVDDGSTDSTLEIVKKFPVQVLTQKHLGAGLARNLGAKQASGEILVFVDADMTFDQNFIKDLTKPIKNKIIGTFSKDELVSNSHNVWSQCWNINKNLPIHRMLPVDYPDTQPVFRAILKSKFDKVGGFDPVGYNDDWTLAQKLGAQASVAPGAIFYHRNPDNLQEVWQQASWIAKRSYKFRNIGKIVTLIKTNAFFSLINGLTKSIKYKFPQILVFKLVYDLAIFKSVLFSFFERGKYK